VRHERRDLGDDIGTSVGRSSIVLTLVISPRTTKPRFLRQGQSFSSYGCYGARGCFSDVPSERQPRDAPIALDE
jgi:hypothetical protein